MYRPLLIILFIFFTSALFSQVENVGPLGIKAGYSISNIKTEAEGKDTLIAIRSGVNVAVFLTLPLYGPFNIQSEISYLQSGGKKNFNDTPNTIKLDYILIPLLFKYEYKKSGLSVYAGPQLGMLVNAKSTKFTEGVCAKSPLKQFYKTLDYALILGIDLTVPVGLVFSARNQFSLSNIAANSQHKVLRNNAAVFTIGYRL